MAAKNPGESSAATSPLTPLIAALTPPGVPGGQANIRATAAGSAADLDEAATRGLTFVLADVVALAAGAGAGAVTAGAVEALTEAAVAPAPAAAAENDDDDEDAAVLLPADAKEAGLAKEAPATVSLPLQTELSRYFRGSSSRWQDNRTSRMLAQVSNGRSAGPLGPDPLMAAAVPR